MGATVTRKDPRTGSNRTYYKADDGKLYADYNAAVKARGNPIQRFAGDALAGLARAGGDIGGWAMSSVLQGVGTPLRRAATAMTQSSNWGKGLQELPRVVNSASKLLTQHGLPPVQAPHLGIESSNPKAGTLNVVKDAPPTYARPTNTAQVSPNSPSWLAAHELGHMVDLQRRQPFSGVQSITNHATAMNSSPHLQLLTRQSGEGRSLMEAGGTGALTNLGSFSGTIQSEYMADHYGKQIAKSAGTPWSRGGNALAKGTYWHLPVASGFAQGVAGEVMARVGDQAVQAIHDGFIDPAATALRGQPSATEKALEQYGYDRKTQVLDSLRDGNIRVRQRSPIGRAVVNRIEN